MIQGSLFAGIGGFDLAARWAGWHTAFFVEIDLYCQLLLIKNFGCLRIEDLSREEELAIIAAWRTFKANGYQGPVPPSILYYDIKKTDFTPWRAVIDILAGGFPCQPYSSAGKRGGTADERHLWPEMSRAFREIAPPWGLGENVRGLTTWNAGMVFEDVCVDLETQGYEILPGLLPAAGVGAPHERYRIWIVAYGGGGLGTAEHGLSAGQPDIAGQAGAITYADDGSLRPQHALRPGRPAAELCDRPVAHAAGDGDEAVQPGKRRPHSKRHHRLAAHTDGLGRDGREEMLRQPDAAGQAGTAADAHGEREQQPRWSFAESRQWVSHGYTDVTDADRTRLAERARLDGDDGAQRTPFVRDFWRDDWYAVASVLCGVDDGLPTGLDHVDGVPARGGKRKRRSKAERAGREHKMKGLGNAVVPQEVYQIYIAINEYRAKYV